MAEDEAVRDVKRSISKGQGTPEGSVPLRGFGSSPQLLGELLHPEVGRARDIAQPGGFRREHIRRASPDSNAAADAMRRSLLDSVMDPRIRLCLEHSASVLEADELSFVHADGSSDLATVLVILKSTVGGTLMVIPGGFMGAGLAPASALLVVLGGVEIYCMVLLVRCSRALGGASYGEIASQALGRAGSLAVEVSLVLSQFGFVCAEMLYVATNCQGAFEALGWRGAVSVTGVLLLEPLLVVPLAWIRKLKYFAVTNAVANAMVLVALAVLAGYAVTGLAETGLGPDIQGFGPHWMLFAGTSVFSFECINFVIPMYEAHENKATFVPLLVGTLWFVVGLFVAFGAANYMRYGSDTKSVVTLNFPTDSVVGKVMPLAFALASLMNVPLFLFPASTLIEGKIFSEGGRQRRRVKWEKNAIRTLLVLVCVGISVVGRDSVQALVSVIGSFCCVPLAFIYPTIFNFKLCRSRGPVWMGVDCAIGALGVVLFFVTTVIAIQEM